jgi:ligand-binding sensor domain-containing protein
MRSIRLIVLFVLLVECCFSQQSGFTVLNTENGLPSNVVYQTLQDDKGFLWVATDQGIARFDGKNFQLFAREQGVPDIEVLKIEKEKNGRIWILCYNNSIAYFSPTENKFKELTSAAESLHMGKIKNLCALPNGGMHFIAERGSMIYQNNRLDNLKIQTNGKSLFLIHTLDNGAAFYYSYAHTHDQDSNLTIYFIRNDSVCAWRDLGFVGDDVTFASDGDLLYVFKRGATQYFVISMLKPSLQSVQIHTHELLHPYYVHNFTDRYLAMMNRMKDPKSGKDVMEVNVYDKTHFTYQFSLYEGFIAFHFLNDREGNEWVSTLDQGLYVFKAPSAIQQILKPPYHEVNFYSITANNNDALFAGNEKGEIIEYKNGSQQVHQVYRQNKIEWQRNIALSQQNIYTFSDGGIFKNYNQEIKSGATNTHQESKVIFPLNDSMIVSGSSTGLSVLNTKRDQIQQLEIPRKVITALTGKNSKAVYVGATDGLYQYDFDTKVFRSLHEKDIRLKERIVSMCVDQQQRLWVATATNGVLIVQEDRVIQQITERDGLNSNNTTAIVNGKENEIWLGTNIGVCRIQWNANKEPLPFSIRNFSMIDGLSSKIANQLYYKNKQLFVATEKGVCVIPDHVPVPSIPVELVGVQINQRDTLLATDYALNANQKNIRLQFSGIDLKGYFKHVDYSLDLGKTWINLDGNILTLELDHGEHILMVRAVDVNKNIGKSLLTLRFDIATPYWKTWWFWILVTVLIQLVIAYAFYRRHQKREREKRKIELAKAQLASLEQQAFTSLMNPHFMFNALNSIQHYINNQDRQNANRYLSDFASLIRKNFEAAQQAFIPLEQELENVSVYMRLERMRFHDKFTFEIEYVDDLDPEDWMMPTMILQPLVENSILHGLMPSQIPGELILRLSYQGEDLTIEVIDNGIGVENSRALKAPGSKHRSRGMELIYKRLQALSFFSATTLQLTYTVPYTDPKNPGNKTSLNIPAELYQNWKKAQQANQ